MGYDTYPDRIIATSTVVGVHGPFADRPAKDRFEIVFKEFDGIRFTALVSEDQQHKWQLRLGDVVVYDEIGRRAPNPYDDTDIIGRIAKLTIEFRGDGS